MNIRVNKHNIEILNKEPVNEKEINVSKCYFEFDEDITNEFVKEAYFTLNGETYKQIIVNNECNYPSEVLKEKGTLEIGVVAYLVENEEEIIRYNPSPDYFNTWIGSLKDAENTEPITPTDKEQIEQIVQTLSNEIDNLDIDAEKEDTVTTITITKKDGTEKEVEILDGEKGDPGEKGEPGAIKFEIVVNLPTENIKEDTIYLVPITPDIEGNNYAEYIYVNGSWELLGKIGVQVDLTDYVKNIDYASSSTGGVIKSGYYGLQVYGNSGKVYCDTYNYDTYTGIENLRFISKGTLENVIAGKDLTTKAYVDGLVGDINTALDTINGEVI